MAKLYVKNKNNFSIDKTFFNIASSITSIYVFVILAIFPLYTHDMYFDILGARYVFFKILTTILFVLLMLLAIVYLVVSTKSGMYEKSGLQRVIDAMRIENLHKHINWCDVFFLLMLVSMTISTLGAHKVHQFDLLTEGFYGNAGRYQGLECWIMYFIMYLCLSRTYRFKKWHFDFMLLACAFASVWGVTDFYNMNIFGFLSNVQEGQKHQFASSVGNLNTLTNYTCMGFAVAMTLFIIEEKPWRLVFYGLCGLLCLEGSVFGLSDNAVIGTGMVYIVLPFFVVKTRKHFIKYIFEIFILLLGTSSAYWGRQLPNGGWWWNAGSVFYDLAKYSIVRYTTFIFLAVTIILIIVFKKVKTNEDKGIVYASPYEVPIHKNFKRLWTIAVIVMFAFIVFIFVDVNITHIFHEKILEVLSPFRNFLIFNDDWGTHRGHNWRIAFSNFAKFNLFHKLFGYGPDTYLVLTERTFYEEMVQRYGEVYDSAHNEYINYLICEGLIGLVSYLGIIISSLVYGFKKHEKEILVFACICAVIAYAGQAIVNIAIPITTPIYFTFVFMCPALYMQYKDEDLNEKN